MRSLGIVMLMPAFDDDLDFPERIEDFTVEKFIPQLVTESPAVAVLPRRFPLDPGCLRADCGDQVVNNLVNELLAAVGVDVGGCPAQEQ